VQDLSTLGVQDLSTQCGYKGVPIEHSQLRQKTQADSSRVVAPEKEKT
tara:strand:+ start:214 stop:357 length:144 start_codon:yes stop_codon:yes gene_type:complete